MKKLLSTAAFLAVGAGAMVAQAQTPPHIQGSDTLEALTTKMISQNCAGSLNFGYTTGAGQPGPLDYAGGGSTTGENAMINSGTTGQYAAPMSRQLKSSIAECQGNADAQGVAVAADALVVFGDSTNTQSCGGSHAARAESNGRPTNPPAGPFSDLAHGTDWRNVLRLLYMGLPAGSTSIADQDCASAARVTLSANYASLFEGGCTTGTCPDGIKHAFRRGDESGTTDTFLSALKAPGIGNKPFCNGTEFEDHDPIRRNCDQKEQVCEADGTLGLVLPIVVPTDAELAVSGLGGDSQSDWLYNANLLANPSSTDTVSTFGPKVAQAPTCLTPPNGFTSSLPRCNCDYPVPNNFNPPNPAYAWNLRFANSCWTGVRASGTTISRYGTLNGDDGLRDNSPAPWGNRTTAIETGKQRCCNVGGTNYVMDPRVMNLTLRNPHTGALVGKQTPLFAHLVSPAFYRIHANSNGRSAVNKANPGTPICQNLDSTKQLGCLVQKDAASNCSIAYAGFEAANGTAPEANSPTPDQPHAEAFALNNVDPIVNNVIDPVNGNLGAYPASRYLWINTLVGFGTSPLTNPSNPLSPVTYQQAQWNLARCFANADPGGSTAQQTIAGYVSAAGFFPLPGGAKLCNNECSGTCTFTSPIGSAPSLFPAL